MVILDIPSDPAGKTPQMTTKARGWCFTHNKPDEYPLPLGKAQYLVQQLERGTDAGDQGYLHIQGYAYFKSQVSFNTVRKLWTHVEMRRGTHAQAKAYCMKEDSRVEGPAEAGEEPHQGLGDGLMLIRKELEEGKTFMDVESNEELFPTAIRFQRSLMSYCARRQPKRTWQTEGHVYFGPTGLGKSTELKAKHPDAYWKPAIEYWEFYDGEEIIVWDEFKGQIPFEQLKRLLDHTPLIVNIKGSAANFQGKHVYFITNYMPADWYKEKKNFAPIFRRIKDWRYYVDVGVYESFDCYKEFADYVEAHPCQGVEEDIWLGGVEVYGRVN